MKSRLFALLLSLLSNTVSSAQGEHIDTIEVTPKEMKQVVDNINVAIDTFYLYPEKAKNVSTQLKSKLATSQLQSPYDLAEFRNELRSTLVKATQDTNIEVVEDISLNANFLNQQKSGKLTTEVSDDNIGYINFTGNFQYDEASQIINNAMQLTSGVDALIIDLRSAEQVSLSIVQQLLSYYFPNNTQIGVIKSAQKTTPLFTKTHSSEKKYNQQVPLYIVNSAFVAGEWELFSHVLKESGKATIVGESTMGIGHITESIVVGNNIILELPYASYQSPVSRSTWEEFGVSPDYYEKSSDAIAAAYKLAVANLQ